MAEGWSGGHGWPLPLPRAVLVPVDLAFGDHVTRRQDVDLDPAAGGVGGHRPGDRDHTALGGGIAGLCQHRVHAGRVQDHAAPAFHHRRQQRLGARIHAASDRRRSSGPRRPRPARAPVGPVRCRGAWRRRCCRRCRPARVARRPPRRSPAPSLCPRGRCARTARRRPRRRISAADRSPPSMSTSATATRAPRVANRSAAARPMPEAAPVTGSDGPR